MTDDEPLSPPKIFKSSILPAAFRPGQSHDREAGSEAGSEVGSEGGSGAGSEAGSEAGMEV